jgi:hypothetical protein
VNVPLRWTEVTVRHTGYTAPALRERKLQLDCKILEAEVAERPDDPFVLFNLGVIAVERQDWSTALGHLHRSLRGSPRRFHGAKFLLADCPLLQSKKFHRVTRSVGKMKRLCGNTLPQLTAQIPGVNL